MKWVLYCEEHAKGLVLNETNSRFMADLTGEECPEDWVGTTVEAFNDKTVRAPDGTYGGIRLRLPAHRPGDDDEGETEQPSPPSRPKRTRPHRPVAMSEPTSDELDRVNAELEAEVAALPQ